MKRLKKYVLWGMLSIMLQCSVVIYLDKVHFRQSSDFVLTDAKSNDIKDNTSVSIPSEAEDIKVSYDGKYATYKINDKFYLVDIIAGESKEILTNDEKEVLYSTWLPDRNGITIAEKKRNDAGKNVVNIINYNAKTNLSVDVKEICSYSNGMKVDNICTSTSAAVTYVSITNKGKSSNIYRFNIEHDMDTVASKIANLGYMNVFPSKDVLVYKDLNNQRIYSYINGNVKRVKIGNTENMKLLALVDKDKMIMGRLENEEVKEVLSGTLDTDVSTWQKEILDKPVDPDDIYINKNGEVIINYRLEGKVTNLATSKTIKYDGKLLSINNKVISSVGNGKLYIKRIDK